MSKLALGTVQFGLKYGVANQLGQIEKQEAKKIIHLAKAHQLDMVDTAMGYGNCESILGEIGVDDLKVVTKLTFDMTESDGLSELVFAKVRASILRLGVSSLYGLLLHHPSKLFSPNSDALYKALLLLKELGMIKKIGISVYSPDELGQILSKYRMDIVQVPFNIFDQRIYFSGWLDRLKNEGVEIHVRSIFLQGLLLMPENKIPSKFARWNIELTKWRQWLEDKNLTAIQACLSFALSFEQIDRVLFGVDSVEQFSQVMDFSKNQTSISFPDFHLNDESLLNPMNWGTL